MTDTLQVAESSASTAPRGSSNVRHLHRSELPGGGQIVIQGKHAFVGHQVGPEGTTILDVSDPREPKIVSRIMVSHPWSHSHKARVTGDIMVVNSEINPGAGSVREYPEGGFRIYDIKDKSNPKLISFVKTHGRGVHRFDLDENFAYISTEMEGFVGNILVTYDIRNPAKPTEVSRWWLPGQNVAAGETPNPLKRDHRLHHAMRCGDKMFAAMWQSGVAIVDVSDISKPRTLGHYNYDPPFPEPTHTFLGVPFPIGGKRTAVPTPASRTRRSEPGTSPIRPIRRCSIPTICRKTHRRIRTTRCALAPINCASRSTRIVSSMSPGLPAACESSISASRQSRRSAAISFRSPATASLRR